MYIYPMREKRKKLFATLEMAAYEGLRGNKSHQKFRVRRGRIPVTERRQREGIA